METAIVTGSKKIELTLDDLKTAQTQIFAAGLKTYTSEDGAVDKGAQIKGEYGTLQGQTLVYAYAVLRHDKRVKITFSRPDNAYDDAVVNMGEFDKEAAFAAALRIVLGDRDPRFRNKARVLAFVKKVGVHEVAKNLPPVFSDFMFAVAHMFNCKLGKDVKEQVRALREKIQQLVPHLSEADILRIYREEVVEWVSKS